MAPPRGRQQQQDPGPPDDGPVYVDEHHQAFSEFADTYLDEDEREPFVEHLMERHGYQRVNSWGPRQDPEPDPDPEPARGGGQQQQRGGGKRPGYFKR